MKTFIGVKKIQAEPAERDGKPGYKVVYPGGYESWSPKDVFEAAYFPIDREDKLTPDDIARFFDAGTCSVSTLGEKTTCVAFTAPTGFVLCDYSSCVRPENCDQEIGATLCKDGIRDDLWTLLGFVLQWADNGLKK